MALLLQLRQKLAQGFTVLWARYPNKSAKKDAEKAFHQVVTTPEIEAEVHDALNWQIPHWQTLEWYQPPYLATYLRKERFRDERPAPKTPTPNRATANALKLHSDPWDQKARTDEALRLMRDEGLTREEAIRKAFSQ